MINIGDVIDERYRITELIGSGGSAEVFEANDLVAARFVAVKILKEEYINNEVEMNSFNEEVKILAGMNHQNIVEVYNEGIFKNRPYVVLEYIKEQALSRKLDNLTKFSLDEAIDIMIQLLNAVDYTNNHGLIHRDIKPQNIFYISNGTVKLGDFGIASLEKECAGRIIGSIQYLAPEILNGVKFSRRSDVYASGITFYQLLTGELPFDGRTNEVADMLKHMSVQKPSKLVLTLPEEIDEIILKATRKNPGERYQNAKEFLDDIVAFKNGKFKKENFIKKIFRKL